MADWQLLQYSKHPVYKNQYIKNLEAKIFCYAPSKQEPSQAWIWIRFSIYELYQTIYLVYKSLKTYCQKY